MEEVWLKRWWWTSSLSKQYFCELRLHTRSRASGAIIQDQSNSPSNWMSPLICHSSISVVILCVMSDSCVLVTLLVLCCHRVIDTKCKNVAVKQGLFHWLLVCTCMALKTWKALINFFVESSRILQETMKPVCSHNLAMHDKCIGELEASSLHLCSRHVIKEGLLFCVLYSVRTVSHLFTPRRKLECHFGLFVRPSGLKREVKTSSCVSLGVYS